MNDMLVSFQKRMREYDDLSMPPDFDNIGGGFHSTGVNA